METGTFYEILKSKMDTYAHFIYRITRSFPRDEQYGLTSQIRRAAVSVVLNYVEGYARRKNKVMVNFFEISYGSLAETRYLVVFCRDEGLISSQDCAAAERIAGEIGAMLWSSIQRLEAFDNKH